jgi:hypothetical protein
VDTPTIGQQHLALVDPDNTNPAGVEPSRWRQALAELPGWLRADRTLLFIRNYWLFGVVLLAALATLGTLLWLVWALFSALGSGIVAAGDGLGRFGTWLAHGPVTHAISDPVRAFLDARTAGLPATGRDLWIVWLVAVGVLYLGALLGSTYARIGWAAIGALSAAAAYFGAPAGAGPAAAGLTVTVWLLLSLLAYARAKSASVLDQLVHDLAARRAARARAVTR